MSSEFEGELYHDDDHSTAECPRCHGTFEDLTEYDVWDGEQEIDCPCCGEPIILSCSVSISYSTRIPEESGSEEGKP